MSTEYKDVYYLFLKFNNYFNRKIIGYETVDEYLNIVGDNYSFDTDRPHQFNPNDYITTEIIENDVDPDYDYLIIVNSDNEIVSRWFIMANVRTRAGQHKVSLRRDVIYDHLSTLLDAPIFVQKGYLPDDDPLIFNDEGMSFNEIKTQEIPIKDNTQVAWIVGYMSKSTPATSITVQAGSVENAISTTDIAVALDMDESDLVGFLVNGSNQLVSGTPKIITYINKTNTNFEEKCELQTNNNLTDFTNANEFFYGAYITDSATRDLMFASASTTITANVAKYLREQYETNGVLSDLVDNWSTISNGNIFLSETSLAYLRNIANNKIPVLYNSVYYYLSISSGTASEQVRYVDRSTIASINTSFENTVSEFSSLLTDLSSGGIKIVYQGRTITFTMTAITEEDGVIPAISTTISSNRRTTEDATYDMFAIPVDVDGILSSTRQIRLVDADSAVLASFGSGDCGKDDMLKIAYQIAISLDANLYDLQLLPYCPLPDKYTTSIQRTPLIIRNRFYPMTEGVDYSLITQTSGDTTNNIGVIFYCSRSSFSFSKSTSYTLLPFNAGINIPLSSDYSVKVMNLVDKYRLCSPNYQGAFDFSLQKNGGTIPAFDIYCTYKPYTPYIKVAPSFSYMYGTDFGDMRGLICGGNFSVSRVNSAWESFELNNKNYQNIFNREIQNLDFNQRLETRNQLVSGAVGILGDASKTAAAGGMAAGGNPIGAIAGAAVGATASAIGYAIDVDTLARQHREAKSLAIDKYNYQLGNIKALPYTLTTVGNFTINSKIFPFLEYYTCTDEEKNALANKIEYESMTVMRIDIMRNYFGLYNGLKYFKGELIRNNDLFASSQMMEAIYNELLKGVYI